MYAAIMSWRPFGVSPRTSVANQAATRKTVATIPKT
jgi:hypothetical protein